MKGGNSTLDVLVEHDAMELLDMRGFHAAELAKVSAPHTHMLSLIDRAIAEKYDATAKIAFEKAGKTDGKVSVDLPGGLKLSAYVGKKVEWDQPKLMAAAKNMPWADVQHYFKIEFGVSEKFYKALPPSSEFKTKLDDARTVKRGDIKISLERTDAARA